MKYAYRYLGAAVLIAAADPHKVAVAKLKTKALV